MTSPVQVDGRWTWTDLRLAPAAATVWAGTLAAPFVAWPGLAAVGTAAFLGALVARRRASGRALVTAAVLAALVLVTGVGAVRAWAP